MLDLFSQMKTVDLLLKFMRGDLTHITPYPFTPVKKEASPLTGNGGLARTAPETVGVSSAYLQQFMEELANCNSIHIHGVMILRHGKIITEANFKPYSSEYRHMMFSLSKSITGMAVGMAVRDGLLSLDEKIVDIFPDRVSRLRSPRINSITVLHLLNMTSGVKFNEVGSIIEKDWVHAFLQSDCLYEPGAEFSYNSMNSYLLSAIVCKKTGMSLKEYLMPRLFEPLGIPDPVWETCPLGIEKGGWGLYLRLCDMAKLGQLYLQGGRWTINGRDVQLVPEEWVKESSITCIPTRENDHSDSYGYQIWNFGAKDAYQFNGVFGQYVIVLPQRDMVIAITSGSENLFSDCSSDIVEQYFGDDAPAFSDFPLKNNPRAVRSLTETLDHLYLISETAPVPAQKAGIFPRIFSRFLGREKVAELTPAEAELNGRKYHLGISFGTQMPFILECVTNNFSGGITEVRFTFEPGICSIYMDDSQNQNIIQAGTDGIPRIGTVRINGEIYAVGATVRLSRDEENRPVMKLFLSYLETPFTRIMKFIFLDNKILIRFDEMPSVDKASKMLFNLVGGAGNTIDKMMYDTIRQRHMYERMNRIMLPRARGTRTDNI